MLVCDYLGCDSRPVRICRIGGIVHDYCLWHRRLAQDVYDVGWDQAIAKRRRRPAPPAAPAPRPVDPPPWLHGAPDDALATAAAAP